MVEEFENYTTISVRTAASLLEVEPGLHAYRRTRGSEVVEKGGSLTLKPGELTSRTEVQGFVDSANRERMLAGRDWTALRLTVLREEGRELFRRQGFVNVKWDDPVLEAARDDRPFDAFVEGRAVPDDVVTVREEDHTLRRRDGSLLPTALHFSYIDGAIRSGVYDLPKLAEHLLARDDVEVYRERRWSSKPLELATTPGEAIHMIPSYNGPGETVSFRWIPDAEAMGKLEAWARDRAKGRRGAPRFSSSDFREGVFETDALGLRAAGAVLFDGYHQRGRTENGDESPSP